LDWKRTIFLVTLESASDSSVMVEWSFDHICN
jgi:hypothetical protein